MTKKTVLTVMGISLSAPYVFTFYFLKISNVFIEILVDLISLVLVITLLIAYLILENDKRKRSLTVIISVGLIGVFMFTYKFQLKAANYIYFKLHERDMNELVSEIQGYGKIYTMTDMQGYYKQINDTDVEIYKDEQSEVKIRRKDAMDVNQYLKEFDIDEGRFETIRKGLVKLKVRKFKTEGDKIFFIMDGFIVTDGYVFSEDGFEPLKYGEYYVRDCQKVADKWFYFEGY